MRRAPALYRSNGGFIEYRCHRLGPIGGKVQIYLSDCLALGVFAKTDIQPLLNDGVAKEDIAASIFQAVVNQTLSGLACGRPLKGNIALLGGPLHYLPQLRRRFIETLSLSEEQALIPDDGRLFVAYGAALSSFEQEPLSAEEILERLSHPYDDSFFEVPRLRPLFKNEKEYTDFHKRHKEKQRYML